MKVLLFSPHPDDESIGCGGVICKHIQQGSEVQTVFLTSGELGRAGEDPAGTRAMRIGEALRAAEVLGTLPPIFLELQDGGLSNYNSHAIHRMAKYISEYKPNVIFSTHPGEEHLDHKAAFDMLLAAYRQAESYAEVWLYEVWTPLAEYDLVEDITPWIGKKLMAIREHYSQIERIRFDEAALALARYRGELHNRPHGPYAEVYKRFVFD